MQYYLKDSVTEKQLKELGFSIYPKDENIYDLAYKHIGECVLVKDVFDNSCTVTMIISKDKRIYFDLDITAPKHSGEFNVTIGFEELLYLYTKGLVEERDV